ncbi:pimeloyl-ACP methyl ester carboxylesterase [Vreelandella songnenensis]|uniref:Pimeloyl-ACP methyl ester carboxylesterase n=1 Tax=Vreelandella songnenensis TaxID=1176243 RepID=A0A2T0UZR4_9GAMM|nr:alpha/beta hydrolase [Halomonas songnenensis]PRY63412.1 pimeloyl-ACP methyl ester carboxylesterase [Halomonas songnenensis]
MVRPHFTRTFLTSCIGAALTVGTIGSANADEVPTFDGELSGFEYAYPVERFEFSSQGQDMQMAYLDVAPDEGSANGRTVVLMHGKNFCAGTWEGTIEVLTGAGYRVIAPDQVGFCKSTKPEHYQFSFHQLAANTHALLEALGVDEVTAMGHSMGGMLATRFALMYPEQTEQLVMVNPIGLEDWKALGVPYQSIDDAYQTELEKTAEGIRAYQESTYYVDTWEPEYDRWVEMLAGMYAGEDGELVAWNQALTSDMVFTQPVVHEFGELQMPTLLLIGEKDNTAIGKAQAPEDVQKTLGHYDVLGEQAAEAIPQATLIEFPELGHSPQIQAPERFHEELLKGLEEQ